MGDGSGSITESEAACFDQSALILGKIVLVRDVNDAEAGGVEAWIYAEDSH